MRYVFVCTCKQLDVLVYIFLLIYKLAVYALCLLSTDFRFMVGTFPWRMFPMYERCFWEPSVIYFPKVLFDTLVNSTSEFYLIFLLPLCAPASNETPQQT